VVRLRAKFPRTRRACIVILAGLTSSLLVILAPYEDMSACPAPPFALTVSAPAGVSAGRSVKMTITGARASSVRVVATEGNRITRQDVFAGSDGSAVAFLTPPFTDRAGIVTVLVEQLGATVSTDVYLKPGTAVDPVDLSIGGRSIVADGADHAMIQALPQDALGNSLADGTTGGLHVVRPTGVRQDFDLIVRDAVAWFRYTSVTTQGRSSGAATFDDALSPIIDLRETADNPLPFTLETVGPEITADGRGLRTVHTSVLADQNGNVLPDGSLVTFRFDGPDGTSQTVSETISGVAEAHLQAPSLPGVVTVSGWSHGTIGKAPISLEFKPAVVSIPAVARRHANGRTDVAVGPVATPLNGYISDGTPVSVTVGSGEEVRSQTESLADGRAIVHLPTAPGDARAVVTVLGVSVDVAVTPDG
jgi:hypothetical protein